MGTQWVFARLGTLVDSIGVRVIPAGRLASDLGVFPRFGLSRQRPTLHAGSRTFGGPANRIVVIDTSGSPRREIGPVDGLNDIVAVRELVDGTVLAVGRRPLQFSYAVWRASSSGAVTPALALPAFSGGYGAADVSPDGTRLAYLFTTPAFTQELRVLDLAAGASTLLEANGRSPRWSPQGHRVAYLTPVPNAIGGADGAPAVINADGSGRRALTSETFSPGLAWSPDAAYVVGRVAAFAVSGLRLMRVNDGASVHLRFRSGATVEDYYQPDWR